MQVHVVDGTFELFRCFFGAPPRPRSAPLVVDTLFNAQLNNRRVTLPDGAIVEVGAVRGLVSTMLSLLKDAEATLLARLNVSELQP